MQEVCEEKGLVGKRKTRTSRQKKHKTREEEQVFWRGLIGLSKQCHRRPFYLMVNKPCFDKFSMTQDVELFKEKPVHCDKYGAGGGGGGQGTKFPTLLSFRSKLGTCVREGFIYTLTLPKSNPDKKKGGGGSMGLRDHFRTFLGNFSLQNLALTVTAMALYTI